MWWVHHLDAEKRQELERNLTVPLLPESPKRPCGSGGMLQTDLSSTSTNNTEASLSSQRIRGLHSGGEHKAPTVFVTFI